MRWLPKDPAYRPISIIALLQAGVVLGGTMFKGVLLKTIGYRGDEADNVFQPELSFTRSYGFLFFLLPVIWVLLAVFVERKASDTWLRPAVLLLGIAGILYGLYRYFLHFLGFDYSIGS